MALRSAPQASPKLLALQRDFQQIASMAGYLNSALDLPQLRLFFTLYGRVLVADPAEGLALTPRLQAWAERLGTSLREDSSSAIMPPQITLPPPQPLPNGQGHALVATISFATKVTDNSYQRVRGAVLAAYQSAVALRDKGVFGDGPAQPGDQPPTEDQAGNPTEVRSEGEPDA
jgi:hypothetical protein